MPNSSSRHLSFCTVCLNICSTLQRIIMRCNFSSIISDVAVLSIVQSVIILLVTRAVGNLFYKNITNVQKK